MPTIQKNITIALLSGILFLNFYLCTAGYAQTAASASTPATKAATNDDCFACHSDSSMALLVDQEKFNASVHGKSLCTSCHTDLIGSDFPHKTPAPVDCGHCHVQEKALFSDSVHGRALAHGDKLAPRCVNCHGNHDILPVKDPHSNVSPFHIPFVCGSCHSEGQPVALQRQIPENHILENYSESMHGEALLKKGLNVAATCSSCHSAHQILPHTDPRCIAKSLTEHCGKKTLRAFPFALIATSPTKYAMCFMRWESLIGIA